MQLAGLMPEDFKANIAQAKERVNAALAEYEAAQAELAWWRQGLRLLEPEAPESVEVGHNPQAALSELFPLGAPHAGHTDPTLRQAVALVMHADSGRPWTVGEIAQELKQKGWLPARRDAQKRVSDIAGLMVQADQLVRHERGLYALAPHLAAALESVLETND
jgi:hypothetical protein